MDAGIIAKLKGHMRKLYGTWVVSLTRAQLSAGTAAADIVIPSDIPTMKDKLFRWLSESVDILNADSSGVVHCWEKTNLLQAWTRKVQMEASTKVNDLFPKIEDVTVNLYDEACAEDPEAGTLD